MVTRKIINVPPIEDKQPKRTPEQATYEQAVLAAELGEAPSIDLHGLDRVDAIRMLDAEISHHAAIGTEVIEIIHGRGTGALRDAVRSHLKSNMLVAYFRDADHPGKQGGVTYAALYEARQRIVRSSDRGS
jgi:DNA mismatch repair protein MutS2